MNSYSDVEKILEDLDDVFHAKARIVHMNSFGYDCMEHYDLHENYLNRESRKEQVAKIKDKLLYEFHSEQANKKLVDLL